MKSFVYNTGTSEPPKDEIPLSVGMFFDGTNNNLWNIKIREDGDHGIKLDADDQKAYDSFVKNDKKHKSSYFQDYSNVARLSMATKKNYKIYVDGSGTEQRQKDRNEGLGLGSGDTGIRGKVRKGCGLLGERIREVKDGIADNQTIGTITLDVFGFSRGAAVARNFTYEVNCRRKRAEDVETTPSRKIIGFKNNGIYKDPIYQKIKIDRDKKEVNPAFLENGKMPKYGYLGYYLLSNGILTKEELEDLSFQVRFIGLFDTVASYEEADNNTVKIAGKLTKAYIKSKFNQGFDSGVESLQLNQLGPHTKAVHYMAKDEHRLNFALTKLPGAEEKWFPGVHSDIGGGYIDMQTTAEEVTIDYAPQYSLFTERIKYLVSEHWYQRRQLTHPLHIGINLNDQRLVKGALKGIRKLKKEYSFIPLHFMEDSFKNILREEEKPTIFPNTQTTINRFSTANDPVLKASEKRLYRYVFEGGDEWVFKSDEILALEKQQKEMQENREQATKAYEPTQPVVDNLDPAKWRNTPVIQPDFPSANPNIEYDEDGNKVIVLEEVVIEASSDQGLLRKLRNEYLHWSSDWGNTGMQPTFDWKRKIY